MNQWVYKVWLPLFLALFLSRESSANIFYFEFGGGLAQGKSVKTIHPSSLEEKWSGSSVPVTMGYQLQASQSGVLFSLAAQGRYAMGSNDSGSYTLLTTSPILRMEIWKIVLGVGYSPWVWRNVSFSKIQASSMIYEAQILFPITPEIDFGLQGAQQKITPTGGGSALTTLEYGAFFRLNFGMDEKQASQRRKYKGWRYPFGNPK